MNDAVTALVQRGNTDALKALIEEYKDLKEADYTADSWKEYADALKAAKAIVGSSSERSDQAAVDGAQCVKRRSRSIGFPENRLLIKSELQAAYDKYKDKKNDGYTAESWAKFENALKSAKAILDNEGCNSRSGKSCFGTVEFSGRRLTKTQTPPKNDPQTPSTPITGREAYRQEIRHM